MKLYLVAASMSVALAMQTELLARSPTIAVEVVRVEELAIDYIEYARVEPLDLSPLVTLDDTAHFWKYQMLDLSTSLDTANLYAPTCIPWLKPQERVSYAEARPPKYDYRNARKVERRYNAARRYYKRRNRRDNRILGRHARERAREEKQLSRDKGKRQPPTSSK